MNGIEDATIIKSEASKDIRDSIFCLEHLGRAFSTIGNYSMAEQLYDICKTLDEAQKNYENSWNTVFNELCGSARQSIGNLLTVALDFVPKDQDKR